MDIIDNIVHYFKTDENERELTSPEGTCSLCWGRQQYDGKIRDILKDKQVDVNNHKDSYMIIEEFVKDNVDGFSLKDGDVNECPACSGRSDNATR